MGKAGATRRRARSPRRRTPRARAMRSRTALSAARVVPKAAATTESAVGETHVATRRRPGQTTRLRRDCEAGDGSGLEPDGAVPGHRHLHDAIAPVHEIERPREARAASVTPSAPSPPRSRSTRADHSEHGDDLLLTAAGRGDVDLSSRMDRTGPSSRGRSPSLHRNRNDGLALNVALRGRRPRRTGRTPTRECRRQTGRRGRE